MARPKKEKELALGNIITIRLNDTELEHLNRSAELLNLSRPEYLRSLITEKPLELKYEIVAESSTIRELCAEVGNIGSNLNQIAKYFHTGGVRSQIMQDQIHECIDQLFDLRKQIIQVAGDTYDNIETQDK